MLLHSLKALCKAPGGAGSIWEYLEAVVRATRVSGRVAYGFRTELHFADVVKGSGAQIEGEMRPSCSTREGDADQTISLAYSDVTGSDDIMSPMVDEGTQVAQSRTTTGKKRLSKKEWQRMKEEKQERFECKKAEGKER